MLPIILLCLRSRLYLLIIVSCFCDTFEQSIVFGIYGAEVCYLIKQCLPTKLAEIIYFEFVVVAAVVAYMHKSFSEI